MDVLDRSGERCRSGLDRFEPRRRRYRFRQRPGGKNSLGLVKFMFPNRHNVYLHDTPAGSLFARATRSFSHGCVRIAQPEQLAGINTSCATSPSGRRIAFARRCTAESRRPSSCAEPLPVYLGYWTARVSADGLLQFRDDLYNIDARQDTRLRSTVDRLKSPAEGASGVAPAIAGAVALAAGAAERLNRFRSSRSRSSLAMGQPFASIGGISARSPRCRRPRARAMSACSVVTRSSGSQGLGRTASQPARLARDGSCMNGA